MGRVVRPFAFKWPGLFHGLILLPYVYFELRVCTWGVSSLSFLRAGLLVRTSMPKGLRRRYGSRHLHFITCSCYRRLPLFASARAKNLFVKILGEVRDRYGFALAGYVVMPNHIHLLISEPARGTPSTVMQVLKQRVSRRLRRKRRKKASSQQLRLPFRHAHDLPQFWQPRFYDFTGAGSTWSPPEKRMESNQVRRETPLHAHESGEAASRLPSQRLAVE
jgi:REP element-mobilizing transposase RayT